MNPYYTAFVYTVWFLATYFVVAFLLHAITYRKRLFDDPIMSLKELPKVSIVVPAFNEEAHIAETLNSLEKLDYPKELLEIIVLNDGSKDKTGEIAQKFADGSHIILVNDKNNRGKAARLNQGIRLSHGDFIVCMDSDTQVMPNILMKTLPQFKHDRVGAVTVTVELKNKENILQKIIDLEYILGLSLFLKVFSYFNCVFVTPGPFSVFRKSVLSEIGGFDEKNITEDLEIAYRIHKAGYVIENTMQTKVSTYSPPTFRKLYVQRKRWYSGAILTFWQHRGMLLDKNVGLFRYFMPFNYSLVFLGIGLFFYSMFLLVSNAVKLIMLYSHTGFNFFAHMTFSFDPFSISIFSFYGLTSTLLTIIFVMLGLYISKRSILAKISGVFGYLFIFFLYTFFWTSSLVNVAFGRKVKWR
jgi:cellulose synthase/poly-beta-1,6-N-acetylglucosamine synthase-like glycosyltransferase